MARTKATPGTLMSPLACTSQREADFVWIGKVIDVPQAMGTLSSKPIADLSAARGLARIGVVRAGVQETYLREMGLTNLVVFTSPKEVSDALARGEIDAWYSTATQIALEFEQAGLVGQVRIGPTIQVAPVWLAANRDTTGLPVAALATALAELERTGRIEQRYRSYVPA
jgi:Bacterial extracellular solute-binding proteins, family 3